LVDAVVWGRMVRVVVECETRPSQIISVNDAGDGIQLQLDKLNAVLQAVSARRAVVL